MSRPNVILVMCDDLGYGDVGFNGHEVIQTPHLDAMVADGLRFTRFYAGGPVCSPTRGTCLTGRHYFRYGVTTANRGHLPVEEMTLAKMLKSQGYRTGHFGKWHLGTLTRDRRDSRRGGREDTHAHFAPPWGRDFDVCFSTEARVPTWNPMVDEHTGEFFGTHYWNEEGVPVDENMEGDDSRVVMDRALPFIRESVKAEQPFLSVIWFHTPHEPVVAGPEYRAMYADCDEGEQHYYGCVTAMDEQVGRLRAELKALDVDENTMVWFCSDNGPEGQTGQKGRQRGSTAGLRGRKRSLFNGGVGVPACMVWPGRVTAGSVSEMPCSTLDYFPTVMDVMGYQMPDERPIDGISLVPVLRGEMTMRPIPIPYRFLNQKDKMFGAPTIAMIGNQFKYLTNLSDTGEEDLVYDLLADPFEMNNVIDSQRAFASDMQTALREWLVSCEHSHNGDDYSEPFTPVFSFEEVSGDWSMRS
jgi:arylsulfatase A-like enzyme